MNLAAGGPLKSANHFSLVTIFAFFCFLGVAKADRDVAQCTLTNKELSVLAPIITARGHEFFSFKTKNITTENLLGEHDGSEATCLLEQLTLPKSFKTIVSKGTSEGEVNIDIKGCDLSNLKAASDFRFKCNVISY